MVDSTSTYGMRSGSLGYRTRQGVQITHLRPTVTVSVTFRRLEDMLRACERVGPVVIWLKFTQELSCVQTVYVSNLKKMFGGARCSVPLDEIVIDENLVLLKKPF
ncbi:hypothetical protein Tco_0591675 [Tanacetum coccineum]